MLVAADIVFKVGPLVEAANPGSVPSAPGGATLIPSSPRKNHIPFSPNQSVIGGGATFDMCASDKPVDI